MLLEILIAAIIGISFGNAWICIFMGFGTTTQHRSAGKWFVGGRFLGLMVLGSIISLFRFAAQDAMPVILLIFGMSTIIFGLFMLFKHSIKNLLFRGHTHANWKKNPREHIISSLLSLFMVMPGNRKCQGGSPTKHLNRNSCHHHEHNKGQCDNHRSSQRKYGFYLGVLRGATPCAKVIVLAPLLVAFGFPSSLLLIFVYASASTIYPVIGYLSADLLLKFEKHRFALKILGALTLITLGVYTIIKLVMWDTAHIGI